jgi:glycosyltransferase involved in cell wall biosynthesis
MLLKGLLRTRGVDLAMIVSDQLGDGQLEEQVDIHYAQSIGRAPLRLYSFSVAARRKIEELIRKGEVDIIHYTNDYCGFAIPKRGVDKPLIATMHHPYALEAQVYRTEVGWDVFKLLRYHVAKRPLLVNMLQRNLCNKSQKLIAVSKFSAASIVEEHRVPWKKVTVVPNGVDQEVFNPKVKGLEMRERWGFSSERVLLFTGRLDHSKGLRYLMEAFNRIVQRVPDVKLVIVGEGILKNQLLQFAKKWKLQDSVKFTGRLDAESLPEAYAAADIIVCPSLMEGFGLSLLEAMAMGKPCVAAASGGMMEIVTNGEDGVLVPPADSSALQRAIEMLLSDSNLCKRLGTAARKKVETDFTLERMVERTVAVYNNAM